MDGTIRASRLQEVEANMIIMMRCTDRLKHSIFQFWVASLNRGKPSVITSYCQWRRSVLKIWVDKQLRWLQPEHGLFLLNMLSQLCIIQCWLMNESEAASHYSQQVPSMCAVASEATLTIQVLAFTLFLSTLIFHRAHSSTLTIGRTDCVEGHRDTWAEWVTFSVQFPIFPCFFWNSLLTCMLVHMAVQQAFSCPCVLLQSSSLWNKYRNS